MSGDLAEDLTQGIFDYYRKRYPYSSKYTFNPEEQEKYEKSFSRWYTSITIVNLLIAIPVFLLQGWVLYQIYVLVFTSLAPANSDIFLFRSWLTFCIPGSFLLLATVSFGTIYLDRNSLSRLLLGGRKYDIYKDIYYTRQGFDGKKMAIHVLKVTSFIFLVVYSAFATSGIIVHKGTFTIKQFYDLYPHKYLISDIKSIRFYKAFSTPSGDIESDPHYKIKFKNADHLNTIQWPLNFYETVYPFVSQLSKNGLSIDTMAVHKNGASMFDKDEEGD